MYADVRNKKKRDQAKNCLLLCLRLTRSWLQGAAATLVSGKGEGMYLLMKIRRQVRKKWEKMTEEGAQSKLGIRNWESTLLEYPVG